MVRLAALRSPLVAGNHSPAKRAVGPGLENVSPKWRRRRPGRRPPRSPRAGRARRGYRGSSSVDRPRLVLPGRIVLPSRARRSTDRVPEGRLSGPANLSTMLDACVAARRATSPPPSRDHGELSLRQRPSLGSHCGRAYIGSTLSEGHRRHNRSSNVWPTSRLLMPGWSKGVRAAPRPVASEGRSRECPGLRRPHPRDGLPRRTAADRPGIPPAPRLAAPTTRNRSIAGQVRRSGGALPGNFVAL